jgi:hypothetical protein
MRAKKLCVMSAVLLCLVVSACGYRLARFDNPELEGFSTIAVPYFQNKSYEPGIDAIFTYAFVNKFIETGRLRVAGVDEADLVLRGTIKKVDADSLALSSGRRDKDKDEDDDEDDDEDEDPLAWAGDRRALEWRVWVTIGVVVEERTTGRVLWSRGTLRHGEEFRISDDIQIDEADKRRAFQTLAADLAEQVHDSFLHGF